MYFFVFIYDLIYVMFLFRPLLQLWQEEQQLFKLEKRISLLPHLLTRRGERTSSHLSSYSISSYLTLSNIILSYLISKFLTLSSLVLSYFILSYLTSSYLTIFHLILSSVLLFQQEERYLLLRFVYLHVF